MKRIRQSKKKMRVPLIIMTIILAVGLVGSFAIWSAPDLNTKNGKEKEATPEVQIQQLQTSIDSLETSLKESPKDFGILSGLAETQYKQSQLYFQIKKQDEAKALTEKSLQNYLVALDNAPKELNNKGQADIMVKAANAAWYSGQVATSDTLYQQATQLVPDDFNVLYQYALYLALNKQDFAKAKTELENYKKTLPAGDSRIANLDNLLKGINEIEKVAKAPKVEEKPTEGSDTEKPATE